MQDDGAVRPADRPVRSELPLGTGRARASVLDSAPTRFIRTFVPREGFRDSAVSETHFRDL